MDLKKEIGQKLEKFIENGGIEKEKLAGNVKERLVDCLLDGTVYGVVSSLEHLQELRETELLNQRYRKVRELADQNDLEGIKTIDREIMEQIDELVQDQQSNLCCMGIPLFRATLDPDEVKTQMDIIKFIVSIKDLFEK
ncbi:unnamed protein product [Bursaphelenchus xylophilus]|uniref:(pine wood nematode) hypothetical protein n=1 Tax=Bursaphelenchus xylophilus TaxID=6326 RepID=A0A1I7SA31_BURXY|nr:unnamed protein product [Bursaphelenchus xylophilus]CAG9131783.1 unnamed protein product [Bursaphelenchus xylophilus]